MAEFLKTGTKDGRVVLRVRGDDAELFDITIEPDNAHTLADRIHRLAVLAKEEVK